MGAEKRYPQRTCVGCRETKDKKDLIRIVRTPEGTIETDLTGRKNGRGAYLCPGTDCLKKSLKNGGLAAAFKMRIEPETAERLLKEAEEHG